MNNFTSLPTSSVGRKLVVGLTGLFLSMFLVMHCTVNLFLLRGDHGELFNSSAEFLATYPVLRPIEIGLFLLFIVHAFYAVWLWFTNRSARPDRYVVSRASDVSTLQSRTMIITAIGVFVFLVIHIWTFFISSRFFAGEHGPSMYQRVEEAFANPVYALFYIVAMGFLAYHLRHGFQSAFQTYGLRTSKYQKLIEAVAVVFWLFIPLGFALMPIYFMFRAH